MIKNSVKSIFMLFVFFNFKIFCSFQEDKSTVCFEPVIKKIDLEKELKFLTDKYAELVREKECDQLNIGARDIRIKTIEEEIALLKEKIRVEFPSFTTKLCKKMDELKNEISNTSVYKKTVKEHPYLTAGISGLTFVGVVALIVYLCSSKKEEHKNVNQEFNVDDEY